MHVSNRNTQIIPYKSLDLPYDKGFYFFLMKSGQNICTNEFVNLVTAKKRLLSFTDPHLFSF